MKTEGVGRGRKIMIEPMTFGDLDGVGAIEEASYSVPWKRSMFEAELNGNPFSRLFVARDAEGAGLQGYVCFWVVFDELHLLNLAVHPDARRHGIGEELAQWTLSRAKKDGARRASLEVRASNEAARKLYEKLGFKVSAVRHGYYREPREDGLIMSMNEW